MSTLPGREGCGETGFLVAAEGWLKYLFPCYLLICRDAQGTLPTVGEISLWKKKQHYVHSFPK